MRNEKTKKTAGAVALAMALAAGIAAGRSRAETVLRIGMTAADIPRTLGQPDQGFEGNRFTGLTMYDALTMWDLSSSDKPSVMIPGLCDRMEGRRCRQEEVDLQASSRRHLP